ncbi:hypothetical protein I3842_05G174200 [Carya illinoinensis]|uniref:Mannan endo-1,4-beta-mannosidase n=1 Tax=Carya illinoinensis TaxID=32201 RepID=A0A922F4R2_CARIL|nr:hypothetical protein I3842_05G174200 [Carya illinoinensis]
MGRFFFFSFLSLLWVPIIFPTVMALPLYTNSRWIVDAEGQRVRLACVNWVSHMEVVVAEGLSKQPVDAISGRIKSMGFNCVRLTWPLFLATNDSLASLTVRQSFQNLGLSESIAGIQANNPPSLGQTRELGWVLHGFGLLHNELSLGVCSLCKFVVIAVVSSLGTNNMMVILDNHISKPGWCCSASDRNGFFGDGYFNPDLWVKGLTQMARIFNAWPMWYMQKGAEAVHSANPDVLVILSGLNYDKDLSFIRDQPPLFVSEFGIDLRGTVVNDNRYFNCFMAVAAEHDLDWALWTLVGSYYLRKGVIGLSEYYGVLDSNWRDIRNPSFLKRISTLQSPFQGPGLEETNRHKVIFHPLTMHISTKVGDGTTVCLDVDSSNNLVTTTCKCISRDNMCDPGSQWFKLVDSTRSSNSKEIF